VNGFQPQLLDGKRKLVTGSGAENGEVNVEKGTNLGSAQAAMSAVESDDPSDSNHLISDGDRTVAFAEPGLALKNPITGKGDICPSCGQSSLIYQEGCAKCYLCAHSEC
jgi:hypothetical protein